MVRAMKGFLWAACASSCILSALAGEGGGKPQPGAAQQAEMDAYARAGTPGAPHAALAATAGEYHLTIKSWQEPGADPAVDVGKATRRMVLDGRVLVESLDAAMMGQPFKGHAMMGYDNVSGEYWSTWMDSMSTGMMVSHGSCDAAGACTFTGSWNDPVRKGPVTARMTTRWTSPTTQLFEMFGPGRDGKEMKMMEMLYTKQ
ncbi:MAG: DUF1579 family protein [Steroidobacteraceae bacterium]